MVIFLFYNHYYTYRENCGPTSAVFTGGDEGHNKIYYFLDLFFLAHITELACMKRLKMFKKFYKGDKYSLFTR